MTLARSFAFTALLALVPASVVACGGTVEQPQTSANAATKAPVGAGTHGLVKVAGDALGEVPLRADQRAELEKLAAEADARHAGMAEGRKELFVAIADQVEKGTIDRAALQPKIDRVVSDMEKVRPADEAALARVHAILDPEQRGAFVDALEDRMHHGKGKMGKGKGKRGKGGPGHARGALGGLGHLAHELKLTDEQRAQIRDVMMEARKDGPKAWGHGKKGREGRVGKRGLEAFRGDTFDPSAMRRGGGDMKEKAAAGTTRMLDFAEKILPILTPEQRKIAADELRSMSAAGGMPFAR